jgi:hypothetical protein
LGYVDTNASSNALSMLTNVHRLLKSYTHAIRSHLP